MIQYDFPFNPKRDKTPVSNTGYVDLKSAFVNMAIPSQIAESDSDYNGIEEPSSILGKPRDVFEAMEMESYVRNYSPAADDKSDSANS